MVLRRSKSRVHPLEPRGQRAADGDTPRGLSRSAFLLGAVLHFVCGALFYCVLANQPKSFAAYIYFTIVTLTTVGYGDIDFAPDDVSKLFTCVWALTGLISFTYALSTHLSAEVEDNDQKRQKRKHKVVQQFPDLPTSIKALRRVSTRQVGQMESTISQKFIQWRSQLSSYTILLFQCAVLNLVGITYLMSAGEFTFVEALYCCVITGTTIGFGDYSPHVKGDQETINRGGKWFGIFYIIASTIICGQLITRTVGYAVEIREEQRMAEMLRKLKLNDELIRELDKDGDGDITRSEWIRFCVKRLDLIDPDVMAIITARFDQLDESGDGVISRKECYHNICSTAEYRKWSTGKFVSLEDLPALQPPTAVVLAVSKFKRLLDNATASPVPRERLSESTLKMRGAIFQDLELDNHVRVHRWLRHAVELQKLATQCSGVGQEVQDLLAAAAVLHQRTVEGAAQASEELPDGTDPPTPPPRNGEVNGRECGRTAADDRSSGYETRASEDEIAVTDESAEPLVVSKQGEREPGALEGDSGRKSSLG